MQKVAKNKGARAKLMEPHHILHLAAEPFSAARLWFVLKQNLIKILAASSFLLELSECAVSVSNGETMKRTTGAMTELVFAVGSLDLSGGFCKTNAFTFGVHAVLKQGKMLMAPSCLLVHMCTPVVANMEVRNEGLSREMRVISEGQVLH